MASLTGSTIAASYEQLLSLPDGGLNGNTLVAITDGDSSTAIGMKVATNKIEVIPGSNDANAFEVSQADGTAILTVDSSTPKVTITGDTYVANGSGVIVGHTSQETISIGDGGTDLVPEVQILGTAQADASLMLAAFSTTATSAGAPLIALVKGGNGTIGSHTVVTDGEELGNIIAYGDDGTDLESPAASIQFEVDGTPGTGDMPGRIIFNTTSDGGESLTERMRITSDGYVVNEQGRQDHVANTMPAPYYRFDGSNDYIEISADANIELDQAITVAMWVQTSVDDDQSFMDKYGNDYLMVQYNSDNGLFTWYTSTAGGGNALKSIIAYNDGKWHHLVGTYDSSASGNNKKIYVDGVLVNETNSATGVIDTSGGIAVIGSGNGKSSYWVDGQISDAKLYNLALSATEVKELYSGASVPFKYKGANQTELIAATNDRTFAGASNWADSGSASYDETTGGKLSLETDATYEGATLPAVNAPMTIGKRYRLKFDTSGASGDGFLIRNLDQNYIDGIANVPIAADTANQTYEFTYNATTGGGLKIIGIGTGSMAFDNFSLVQIGAVAEYDGSGASSDKWFDKSGNDLHGTVTGATVENAPSGEDDGLVYEEGTWTVSLLGDSAVQLTTSAQSGKYTRIGNLVYCSGYILVNSENSAGGAVYIQGAPFTSSSGTSQQGGTVFKSAGLAITDNTSLTLEIEQNNTAAYIKNWDVTTGTSAMQVSEFSADGAISFSFTYTV